MHYEFRQDHRLALSQAMQRAFHVLKLPSIELAHFLEKAIDENPLLQKMGDPVGSWDAPEEISLYQFVLEQALIEGIPRAADVVGLLDRKGFITDSIDPNIREEIQRLDPPGIGARNVQEALLIQLRRLGMEGTMAYLLVTDHYEDLLHKRWSLLEKKFGEGVHAIIERDLSKLDPFPGYRYGKSITPYSTPDISISFDEEWTVEIKDSDMPQFTIDDKSMMMCTMRRYKAGALWLKRILGRRKRILLDLATALIKFQGPFMKGEGGMKPLSMKRIAEEVGVSESTVARAVSGKMIDCPVGLLPLKSFFKTNTQAKDLLLQLIGDEDKRRPLSDLELVERMSQKGVKVARRTIAKYRRELGIDGANHRKVK